ncbi:MAG TPA: hypothetical protein VNL16_09440 [Chloroflexota bacterium]|nr:hypothetical protein [Chloroflexota bacterium]
MSSVQLRPRHRLPSAATLLTIGAFGAPLLFLIWGIIGFIVVP